MRSTDLSASGVYSILMPADSRAYVGVTGSKTFHAMFQRHRSLLRIGKHFAAALQEYYNSGKPISYKVSRLSNSIKDQRSLCGLVVDELVGCGLEVLDVFSHPDVGFTSKSVKVKSSFTLSEETMRKLAVIADVSGLSKSKVIELLVSAVASGELDDLKSLSTEVVLRGLQF